MTENLFETQYNVTKKTKLRIFYEKNKILIIGLISIFIISIGSFSFFLEKKENRKIKISEDYLQARIYLGDGLDAKAENLLKEIVFLNDPTYSAMSLFLIINKNLYEDRKDILVLFDHLLSNNKFEKEIENLIIYKKIIFSSNFVDESKLLEDVKPLLNRETLWKPHALLLMGDYFKSKNELIKAKEFYIKILSVKNLQKDFYDQVNLRLAFINND